MQCQRNRQSRISLFTQYHMDQLNLEQSAVEFLCDKFSEEKEMKDKKDKTGYVRRRLGRFKLTGKQHTQKMKFLSGGQKSRVAFCCATWSKPHFLIMDEPTNHLDMETIDSLVNAIESFPGGVLVISHDQHFLKAAANEYWAVTKNGIQTFDAFNDAKKFALRERMTQIGDHGIVDLEDEQDKNKVNYDKKKRQQKEKNDNSKLDNRNKKSNEARKKVKKSKKGKK